MDLQLYYSDKDDRLEVLINDEGVDCAPDSDFRDEADKMKQSRVAEFDLESLVDGWVQDQAEGYIKVLERIVARLKKRRQS